MPQQSLVGMHDWSESWAAWVGDAGVSGWCVTTHALIAESGYDFRPPAGYNITPIARLNWGYFPQGTIPTPDRYGEFAGRCAHFVKVSPGCNRYIIGNEPNHAQEWPHGQAIQPAQYAECYLRCREAIRRVRPDAEVLVAAIAPWNVQSGIPWLTYFRLVLDALQGEYDCFALHAYTHGADPQLVSSDERMQPPYQHCRWHFRVYRDWLSQIPAGSRHLPVYITEANQGDEAWLDQNTGWVQAAYQEVHEWNRQPGIQRIQVLCLYRWLDHDRWAVVDKPGVQKDFQAALHHAYPSPEPGIQPATGDKTIYVPWIAGGQKQPAEPPSQRFWDPRLTARGVTLVPASSQQPTAGSHYWRLAAAHYLDEAESAGRHHIFVEASPAASALIEWDGGSHTLRCNEQGKADFPMYAAGWGYRVRMAEGASDEVRGLGLGTVEQPHMGHHVSYRLVFWRVVQQEEPMAQGIVAAPAGVNVRSGPGTTYPIVEALPQGTPVNILEERDGWYRIGDGRWVSATYVQRSGPPRNEQEAWQRAAAFTLSMEGGLSTDPNDPGNYTPDGRFVGTKWGISARQYPHLDIPNLTKEQALEIYRRDYWQASGASTLPWPLALVVFETAVNQGVGEARRMLAESGGNLWLLMALRLEDYTEAGTWPYHGQGWVRRAAKLMREIARG